MGLPKAVKLFDTTLRDGCQAEGVSFSVKEKVQIAHRLDDFGIHYIEGGWPGSNPKDIEFFLEIAKNPPRRAVIVAFGSTRRPNVTAEEDSNLKAIMEANVAAAAIFGKTWPLHVQKALRVPLETNLAMIQDSVAFLVGRGLEVIYDAEHFFDGFKADSEYALETLRRAEAAGAAYITLCDTNGGSLPSEIGEIVQKTKRAITTPLGIHAHNDSETAVANSLAALEAGAELIQGTINGYGERCGNANLCSLVPALVLKKGIPCVPREKLRELSKLSLYVSELGNIVPDDRQPYVGRSAFAHKGGIHVSAIQRDESSYEHVRPEEVGNKRRILVSELAGRSNIESRAEELGIDVEGKHAEILERIKTRENQGYDYEVADGSLTLLMKEAAGQWHPRQLFELVNYRVLCDKTESGRLLSEAVVRIQVGGQEYFLASEGRGPVDALYNAVLKALRNKYGEKLEHFRLRDYKVRIINPNEATAALVRVLVESADQNSTWMTVGVSESIIEASWQALLDSIEYKLMKDGPGG